MDGSNLAPHLLADEAIVGTTLRHGEQFTHVQRFALVHLQANEAGSNLYFDPALAVSTCDRRLAPINI